jgi:signal transduction histidine kinase
LGIKIFNNLLSNAIKYSPDKSIVELSFYAKDSAFIFCVKDSGIGIKTGDLSHIFDRFFRGDNVETIQGTGLGLPIVKEAVEMHGGTIKVESKEGRFTKFIVTLPR